jgi:tRNA 2-thiouridine synthesizing protein A
MEPRDISVLDVVTLLQGPVSPTGCAGAGGSTAGCEKLEGCGLVGVWTELKSSSENLLGQTTLRDLISRNGAKPSSRDDEIVEKLDCIGVSCPLPIVHIAECMRKLGTGQILEVWADDEGAKADIPAWCMGTGNDFIGREEFGDQMKFLIRKVV